MESTRPWIQLLGLVLRLSRWVGGIGPGSSFWGLFCGFSTSGSSSWDCFCGFEVGSRRHLPEARQFTPKGWVPGDLPCKMCWAAPQSLISSL